MLFVFRYLISNVLFVKFTNSKIKLLIVIISFVARLLHVKKIDCTSNNWCKILGIRNIQRHVN